MKAKRSALRAMRAKTCEVTLNAESGSVTFDITYDANIPPALLVSLMEMSQIGEDFQAISDQMSDVTGLSDDEKVSRMKKAKGTLADIRDRLSELASLLAKTVISQEYYDDDDRQIPADYEYFSTCDLNDQIAYATAISQDKQRPSTPSATTQPDVSLAEGQKDIPPSSLDVSAPLNGQTSLLSDSTTPIQ
jgi:hypothetical protein